MVTCCNGHSISANSVSVLWINLVVNLYNLTIIWLNDDLATQTLLGIGSEMIQYIIVIETLISIFAIMLSNMKNISLILSMKFWVMALTFAFLSINVILTCGIATNLFIDKILDEFWKIKTDYTQSVAPTNIYLLVAIILTIYLAFKFYAIYVILRFGKTLRRGSECSVNDLLLLNEESIEQSAAPVHTVSSPLPPSYNDSIMEPFGTPPPPYSSPEVQINFLYTLRN